MAQIRIDILSAFCVYLRLTYLPSSFDSLTQAVLIYFAFSNFNAAEFMQYRKPVGFGPLSKTWPRCE